MKFNELAWGAVCFYYRSTGDNKYSRIMRDADFLSRLRTAPADINAAEFEQKVILDYVNIENYDLLVGQRLAGNILAKIVELQPEISSLQDVNLLNCDLSDSDLLGRINKVYVELSSFHGLWLTGVSKIAHVLNDRLFALINSEIAEHFKILEGGNSLVQWLEVTQRESNEVTLDFHEQRLTGSPEQFLASKLGYTDRGYQKSLIKFIDEYFWLRFGENLPVPPRWTPAFIDTVVISPDYQIGRRSRQAT